MTLDGSAGRDDRAARGSRRSRVRASRRLPGGVAILLLLAQILTLLTALLANVILARALGAEGRGQVAFALQASYLVTVVAVMGQDRSFPATASPGGYHNHVRTALRLTAAPAVLAGALTAVLGAVLWLTPNTGSVPVISVAVWLLAVGLVASRLFRSASIVGGRARLFVAVTASGQAVLALLLLALWQSNASWVGWWLAAYAVSTLVPVLFFAASPRLRRAEVPAPPTRRRILRRGLALLPATIGEVMVLRLERVLIPFFAGYGTLGIYVTVATITELASWPAQQFLDSRVPQWSTGAVPLRGLVRELVLSTLATTIVAIAMGILCFFALPVVFGAEFSAGRAYIVPLCITAVGVAVYRFQQNVCASFDVTLVLRVATALSIVGSVVLYPIAILTWGGVGAAWASAVLTGSVGLVGVLLLLWRPPVAPVSGEGRG